jgi:hypothetical protein
MTESMAILSAITALVQPDVWECGFQVIEAIHTGRIQLCHPESTANSIRRWGSCFNGLLIVNDRQTPLHRDLYTPLWAYDLFATFGPYKDCRFSCPTIGRSFAYDPGCAMVGCTRLIEHGISEAMGGAETRHGIKLTYRENMLSRSSSWRDCTRQDLDSIHALFYGSSP